ncbi:MAG: YeeE/YedE family protein [Armatimonadetes bacterium]|nr:YeeE/YedE family protein [Armatimonadota bacterium]
MKKNIPVITGGIIIGILNLYFYLALSPKILARSTAISIGGGLATSLAYLEDFIFKNNNFFSGIPPIIWTLIPGVVVGSFAGAVISKQFSWKSFLKTKLRTAQIIKSCIGGLLIGFGVMLGNGCLFKHALSGLPGLSLESILTLIGIISGIWIAMKIEEKFEG